MDFKKKVISKSLFVLFLSSTVFSQSNVTPSAKFHATNNAIEKRAALREIGTQTAVQPGVAVLASKQELSNDDIALLKEALSDHSPTVVEQAVKKIGELQVIRLNQDILDIYANADVKYGGYAERVKLAVIDAVGNIGVMTNAKFLDNHIAQEIRAPYIHNVLNAVKKLHATSTIPSLNKLIQDYSSKYEGLKKNGSNPLLLSSLLSVLDEAKLVLSSLTTAK